MKSSRITCAFVLAASRVYGALETPTIVARDEMVTLVGRQADDKPTPVQKPAKPPVPSAVTPQGCYKAQGNMTANKVPNMSSGSCTTFCYNKMFPVAGLHGDACYCGFLYPAESDKVEDEKCTYPCPAYPLEACGGLGNPGFWSVFNTGRTVNVEAYQPSSSSSADEPTKTSSSGSDRTGPAVVTQTRTAAPQETGEAKGDTNTATIIAACIGSLIGLALLIGGVIFLIRRRRNSEIEEEHRRNAAVNAFINGSKPPGSSGSMSMTDSRLDPVLAHRRMSDGSIADNEDYSRRILRVCQFPPPKCTALVIMTY